MKACRKLLKKNTRPLSSLRDIVELVLLSKMSLAEDPERYLNDFMDVFEKVSNVSFLENDYMAPAAMMILDLDAKDDSDKIVSKAKELMDKMNSNHPVLTAADDTSFIFFLALTDKSTDSILADLEDGFTYLKETCKIKVGSDPVYELCEVLALSYGDMKDKCDKVMRIYNVLSKHRSDYMSESAFSTLGTLIETELEPEETAREIIEAEECLKTMRGWGDSSIEKRYRVMSSMILVADTYTRSSEAASNSVVSNTMSLIRVKQISSMISIIGSVGSSVLSAALGGSEGSSDPS